MRKTYDINVMFIRINFLPPVFGVDDDLVTFGGLVFANLAVKAFLEQIDVSHGKTDRPTVDAVTLCWYWMYGGSSPNKNRSVHMRSASSQYSLTLVAPS